MIWARRSGEALRSSQCTPSAVAAIEDCERAETRVSPDQ